MTKKLYQFFDGVKSVPIWDETSDAWVYISGKPQHKEDPHSYYKIIPTLYRAVDLRASSLSSLPWELSNKAGNVVDSSDDYQNYAGLVGNMNTMLYLIEASLVLAGVSYWKREKNAAGYDKLRHLDPTSLQLDEARAINGELVWKRSANGKEVDLTTDDIVYCWYPDPYVEIGPPTTWPALSALNACGVLANLDEFAKNYFARGAIKAMLFAMEGAGKVEAEKFEGWFNKFIGGVQNAFKTKVINAASVQPVIIGEGIKELENVSITSEKREEIALAMSIPMSILFANAANYATAERDKLNWYEDKIVPESKYIAAVLNEQVYEPLGLHLDFKPETLDIFQEDEAQRAQSLKLLTDAGMRLDIALRVLGYELDEDDWAVIDGEANKPEPPPEPVPPQLMPPSPMPELPPPAEQATLSIDYQRLQKELSIWQSKCLSAIKRGEAAADVPFVPVLIPPDNYDRIKAGLSGSTSLEAVKDVFAAAFRDEPEEDNTPVMLSTDFAAIFNELKEVRALYEKAAA